MTVHTYTVLHSEFPQDFPHRIFPTNQPPSHPTTHHQAQRETINDSKMLLQSQTVCYNRRTGFSFKYRQTLSSDPRFPTSDLRPINPSNHPYNPPHPDQTRSQTFYGFTSKLNFPINAGQNTSMRRPERGIMVKTKIKLPRPAMKIGENYQMPKQASKMV